MAGLCAALSTAAALPAAAEAPDLPAPAAAAPAGGASGGTGTNTGTTQQPWPGAFDLLAGPYVPAAAAGSVLEPGWRLRPSLDLQLLGTDNADYTASRRRGELITTITPGLSGSANTARVTGWLNYAPTAWIYADRSDDTRLDHRYLGQALVTVVPETFFLDLRGYGALTATAGGTTPAGSPQSGAPVVGRNGLVQTASLQATPYVVRRLGGFATLQAGYGWRYLSEDGTATTLPGAARPFFTSTETTSHEGFGVLRTGDYFGRLAFELRGTAITYDSNGALEGAHRYGGSLQARYALSREIAALIEGGYEDQRYGGTQPFAIQEPIWSVGLRYAPSPDSVAILRYGHRNGYNSAAADVSLALGARSRIFATYADQIGTPAQQTADLLTTTSTDALGNTVSTTTGAPVQPPPYLNSLLATQSSLFRIKRGVVTLSQTWDRDTFSLSLTHDDRKPLTSALGTTGFAQKGTSVGFGWTRLLRPTLTGSAYLQYGHFETSEQGGTSTGADVYTARLALTQAITENLSGTLQYIFNSRSGDTLTERATQNTVLVGLRMTF